ncbi:hypothetical protein QSJ18_06340 [Gordonia sp. ABSL1-1]|uniref:Rv2732c family membrane protein n=1 Tax=Gordonia sp. ABSL1-1 TaxID=3053923 RepID=UPI00257373CA|nr:hypothetical protein [Gordonia sp. ABSL1-1]MDL9936357.1 hypothetical protein [Gordonia sp. ABSL1-1]
MSDGAQAGTPASGDSQPSRAEVNAGFAQYEDELRKAERKVAGEIDPGARALVVAIAVLVAMLSLVLPHAGSASGLEVLTFAPDAAAERISITSKVFVYLLTIFGIGFSMLALVTRRWVIAWIALCGNAIACVAGMLAWWTRNTVGVNDIQPPSGVGVGLMLGWVAALVLTFHWARVVWARSSYQLALEEERRKDAAARDAHALSLHHKPTARRTESDPAASDKPASDKPASDKPASDKPASDKPESGD